MSTAGGRRRQRSRDGMLTRVHTIRRGVCAHLIGSFQHVDQEWPSAKPSTFATITVQFRDSHQSPRVYQRGGMISVNNRRGRRRKRHTDIAVENADSNDRRQRPEDIPEKQVGVLKDVGCTPCAVNLEPPEHTDADDVLVKEVDDPVGKAVGQQIQTSATGVRCCLHVSIASIRPLAMYEE